MSVDGAGDALSRALSGIRDLYTTGLVTHGTTSKAVGWKDEASQRLRFERLSRVAPVDMVEGVTVNDWGCGYGAMYTYLNALWGQGLAGYTGYDIAPQMVDEARRQVTDPRARFVTGSDEVEEADYTFVSGTFNVKLEATDTEWEAYVKNRLEALFAVSRRGLAFNLLTCHVDWREPHLFYADPEAFVDFCLRHLSRHVCLFHDTALYEWTITVSRTPRS